MGGVAQLGRTLLSPFTGAALWYNRTAQRHPLAVGVATTGFKTSAADLFAQKVVEGREEMDWTRHGVFCAFGFMYLGGFQYWLYNIKFTQWCGQLTARFGHRATAPIKTFIDQGIHHPFIYFPAFFSMKAVVSGKPLSSAVEKYKAEIWDSVKALWTVWVPAQLINFAFVPRHLRIPYVAAVSFGWTVILSVMQGKFDAVIAQRQASTAAAAAGSTALLPPAAAAVLAADAQANAAAQTPAPAAPAASQLQVAAAKAAARGLPVSPIVAAAAGRGGGKEA